MDGASRARAEFARERAHVREALTGRAVAAFRRAGAVEGHLLGSLGRDQGDELSDVDLWITFPDRCIARAIEQRFFIYHQIAPLLLVHESRENAPLHGNFSLVIFDTTSGPLMVDFQLSPLSSAVLGEEAKVLFASERLPSGSKRGDTARTMPSRPERVDFLIAMASTAMKYVARDQTALAAFAVSAYGRARAQLLPELPDVDDAPSYGTLTRILDALRAVANDDQEHAIEKLVAYQAVLERLYPPSRP